MFAIIDETNILEVATQYKKAFCANPWNVEKSEIRIHDFLTHSSFRGYINIVDGVIVSAAFGMLQQYYDGLRYNLTDLFTAPEHQNKGYATDLLDFIKAELKRDGIKQIMLISLNDDLHNHFYDTKNGFRTREELCVKRYILSED